MAIQWFPGHMTTARKKAAETMAQIDVVVEVLDARLPEAGSNPMIHELRTHRQRACLKPLNKTDLADPEATRAWLDYFNKQPGVMAVAISAKKPGDVRGEAAGAGAEACAAPRRRLQAAAADDHGHPQCRQIHPAERAGEAPGGGGGRRSRR